ncbi:unnamed protein product [Cladocopium goreaui]|uniref:Uncharacterized protein n=1 Tax=Cladocopium goreaui TaxID=2562237 RepID=A0A9P1GDG7_9DINO|nr:unnamed protein product [Cladocopium goreaui]
MGSPKFSGGLVPYSQHRSVFGSWDFWFANGFHGASQSTAHRFFFFRLRPIKDQTIGLLKSDLDLWKLFDELGIEVHYAQPSPSRVLKGDAREGISAKKVAMSAVLDKYYGDSVKAISTAVNFSDFCWKWLVDVSMT